MALRKRNLKAMIRLPFTLTLLGKKKKIIKKIIIIMIIIIIKIITYLRGGFFGQYTDLLLETVFLTAFYGFLRGG